MIKQHEKANEQTPTFRTHSHAHGKRAPKVRQMSDDGRITALPKCAFKIICLTLFASGRLIYCHPPQLLMPLVGRVVPSRFTSSPDCVACLRACMHAMQQFAWNSHQSATHTHTHIDQSALRLRIDMMHHTTLRLWRPSCESNTEWIVAHCSRLPFARNRQMNGTGWDSRPAGCIFMTRVSYAPIVLAGCTARIDIIILKGINNSSAHKTVNFVVIRVRVFLSSHTNGTQMK